MKRLQFTLIMIVVCSSVLFIGCKDDDDDPAIFAEELMRVWQNQPDTDGDQIGIYFTENEIISWDYLGDSFDDIDDCYVVETVANLTGRDGDEYTIDAIQFEDGSTVEFQLRMSINSNNVLTITDLDSGDRMDHSDTGMSVGDLAPACNFVFKKGSKKSAISIIN